MVTDSVEDAIVLDELHVVHESIKNGRQGAALSVLQDSRE